MTNSVSERKPFEFKSFSKEKLPNIKNIENDVLQSIVGQDKQVQQILTAIYRARTFKTLKTNLLIVGNSGTGKTATVDEIAKKLHIPFVVEDATKYTQEGYQGADVSEMIYNLIWEAGGDTELAQNGIIMIDEIDKKVGINQKEQVSTMAVLKSLLKIIEGTIVKMDPRKYSSGLREFNTRNVIFIMSGAFYGIDSIRKKRLNSKNIGFQCDPITIPDDFQKRFIKKDFIEYGMPAEFMGRINSIVEMNDLSKDDLVTILKKSKLSAFREYQNALREQGIVLSYRGELFEYIAEQALSADTGARELNNVVNYIFERIIYEVLSKPRKYKKCELFLDIVKDNSKFKLS